MTAFSAIRFPARVPEISELFKMGNSARSQNLILMEHETEIFKKSVFYQAVLVWNSLKKKKVNFKAKCYQFNGQELVFFPARTVLPSRACVTWIPRTRTNLSPSQVSLLLVVTPRM